MARINAQQWLQKWGTNLQAAGPAIQNGIANVKVAPGISAAAAADRMASGVLQSIQDGTWQKNVSKVSLSDWQNSMKNKAIPRLSQGVAAAQASKQQSITELLSAVDAATAAIAGMPKGSLEQNIARSAAFQREMAARAPKRNR